MGRARAVPFHDARAVVDVAQVAGPVSRFEPQRRWFILELVALELGLTGMLAFYVWSAYPPLDSWITVLGWMAYGLAAASLCRWALSACFDYIEIGDGVFRRRNRLRLHQTAVRLSELSGVTTAQHGWLGGRAVRVGWPAGSVFIPVPISNDGRSWSSWGWSDVRAIVSCLQQHGVPVSRDALLELNLALPAPEANAPMTRYWPTGSHRGVAGKIVAALLLVAPAAGLIWLNRGVPIARWEAQAFWVAWIFVVLFVVSNEFEYVEIGQGNFRRVGFFTLSQTSVPLSQISGIAILHGWLGIPRITVEWPRGKVEFAPVHLDPRLGLTRWTPYGIRQVVQRLRQEGVTVSDDVLDELGLEMETPEGIE
jgi:hypothetical protein